jgi:acyl dehydratase
MDELRVGDMFTSRARTITEADVIGFAGLTGDFHPAHTDATWAEENIFGQRVAHGMLAVCYSIGLVPNDYIMALRRIRNIVFKRPVFFGDTIRVVGKAVRIIEMSDEVGLVTGRWKVVNQNDETVVTMELDALWRRTRLEPGGKPAFEPGPA